MKKGVLAFIFAVIALISFILLFINILSDELLYFSFVASVIFSILAIIFGIISRKRDEDKKGSNIGLIMGIIIIILLMIIFLFLVFVVGNI
jgi:hypothetical protein